MHKSAIERACDALGGQVELSTAVGVTPQAVNQWVSRKRAPVDRVKAIVRATQGEITAHDLAPGIYPEGFEFPLEAERAVP